MPNFRQLAMNLIGQNPNIANNPQAKQMLDVIQSGNSQEGQRIADNLCNTMGVSREDALRKAKQFFHIPE